MNFADFPITQPSLQLLKAADRIVNSFRRAFVAQEFAVNVFFADIDSESIHCFLSGGSCDLPDTSELYARGAALDSVRSLLPQDAAGRQSRLRARGPRDRRRGRQRHQPA